MSPLLLFMLVFTAAIIIHEAGHYLFARLYGVQVKRASLFFNPFFTLLKYDPVTGRVDFLSKKQYGSIQATDGQTYDAESVKSVLSFQLTRPREIAALINKETGEFTEAKGVLINSTTMGNPFPPEKASWRTTQYCLGWLPCGGYVNLQSDNSPAGILSKKNHQQFMIHFAGVMFNLISMLMALTVLGIGARVGFPDMTMNLLYGFANISFGLALLNVLPLPGLDGSGMLISILNYVLPDKVQIIMRNINSVLGMLVFVFIVSSWFRESSAIEASFFRFVNNCFDSIVMLFVS